MASSEAKKSVGQRETRARSRAQWMADAQRGNAEAYRALLDDIGPELMGFLRARVPDSQDLADLYQETFLALHRSRHTYEAPRPVEPWLFAIAAHVVARHLRRRRTRIAREVLVLEGAGRVRPVVAEAAIADLAGGRPSLFLIAALLSGLWAEVRVRPVRLASLKQAVREGWLFRPQGRAVKCRRKSAASGRQ